MTLGNATPTGAAQSCRRRPNLPRAGAMCITREHRLTSERELDMYEHEREYCDSLPDRVHAARFTKAAKDFVRRAGRIETAKRNARERAGGMFQRACSCCGNGYNGGMPMPPSAH